MLIKIITFFIFIIFIVLNTACTTSLDVTNDYPLGDPGPIGGTGGYSEAYIITPGTSLGSIDLEYRGLYFTPMKQEK